MKWWEKTVEYLFVVKYFDEGVMLAPLDGNEERLADTIFSKDNKWVVIEFKRNEKCIDEEKDKFIYYEKARDALSEKNAHHLLIYGKFEDKLVLECKTYFSNELINVSDALNFGLEIGPFKEYIERFLKFKKPPKDGGGGGLSLEDYELVACVTNDGMLLSCMSISEFLYMFENKPEQMQYKVMGAGN